MYNFNPYLNYQQRLMQMEQQQPMQQMQTIQTIQTPAPQMQAMFVSKIDDLKGLPIMPNLVHIGINQASKEVYIRKMTNDGLTELNTYSLASEKQEKGALDKILERLDNLENTLKGQSYEWNVKANDGTGNARKFQKSPNVSNVSTNDAGQNTATKISDDT